MKAYASDSVHLLFFRRVVSLNLWGLTTCSEPSHLSVVHKIIHHTRLRQHKSFNLWQTMNANLKLNPLILRHNVATVIHNYDEMTASGWPLSAHAGDLTVCACRDHKRKSEWERKEIVCVCWPAGEVQHVVNYSMTAS